MPILILIVAGGFFYSFNLHNGLFWDDDDWIINNNFVHTISWDNIKFWLTHNTLAGVGLKSNYYRPFLFFTFAFNYMVAGVKPLIYHLTSNAIHIFNAVLVFWLIRRIFSSRFDLGGSSHLEVQPQKSPRLNLGTLIAFVTALIFLIHPLQTEAVTYISGRGDALTAMFMLLALILFYKMNRKVVQRPIGNGFGTSLQDGPVKQDRPVILYKIFSVVFLTLGLLSRETAIIFPFLALLFYVAFLSNQGRTFLTVLKQGLIKTWSYFAIVAIYGILRLTVLNFQNTLNFYATPNSYSENLLYRLLTFMHVLVDYFRLLFVPVGLHMERSMTVHTSLFQWPVWLGVLIIISIIAIGVWLYRRNKFVTSDVQRTSDVTVWLFGWGWFFVALAPVSGITPINAVIYEHWLYLPMVGFWFIVAYYLSKLFNKIIDQRRSGDTFVSAVEQKYVHRSLSRSLLIIGLVVYLSFFGYQAIKRNILWGKPAEFYQDILKYEPESVRINNNLGNLYFNHGNVEKAEEYYRQAIEAKDVFPQPHFNIGSILQSRGDIFGAIQEFEKAIALDPNFYYPYQNLAVIYAQQGKLAKARENIEILKSLLPTNPRVFYNSALVYIALNDKKQAIEDLQTGLKHTDLDPETGRLIEALILQLQK